MRFEPTKQLHDGSEPEAVAEALADWGADVIGANCGEGPELVFEVAVGEVEAVSAQVCSLMSGAAELSIPLLVEAGVGDNWDEAH